MSQASSTSRHSQVPGVLLSRKPVHGPDQGLRDIVRLASQGRSVRVRSGLGAPCAASSTAKEHEPSTQERESVGEEEGEKIAEWYVSQLSPFPGSVVSSVARILPTTSAAASPAEYRPLRSSLQLRVGLVRGQPLQARAALHDERAALRRPLVAHVQPARALALPQARPLGARPGDGRGCRPGAGASPAAAARAGVCPCKDLPTPLCVTSAVGN